MWEGLARLVAQKYWLKHIHSDLSEMDSNGHLKAQTLSQGCAVRQGGSWASAPNPYSEGPAEGLAVPVAHLSVKDKGLDGSQEVDGSSTELLPRSRTTLLWPAHLSIPRSAFTSESSHMPFPVSSLFRAKPNSFIPLKLPAEASGPWEVGTGMFFLSISGY